jgi:hypothetical protein
MVAPGSRRDKWTRFFGGRSEQTVDFVAQDCRRLGQGSRSVGQSSAKPRLVFRISGQVCPEFGQVSLKLGQVDSCEPDSLAELGKSPPNLAKFTVNPGKFWANQGKSATNQGWFSTGLPKSAATLPKSAASLPGKTAFPLPKTTLPAAAASGLTSTFKS